MVKPGVKVDCHLIHLVQSQERCYLFGLILLKVLTLESHDSVDELLTLELLRERGVMECGVEFECIGCLLRALFGLLVLRKED